ncbi:TPA: helix-turn-helix domain-containing protein [Clostridioides difficile]|nr:helix-turn-helix domain-containing protein [Clostridioides difficile]MDE3610147.1 helix-turn-helix domain-containing protein [Clostridioides difficile]MDM9791247.1 helix-turn-helix domain-containing protein [Clostridioides difficile]OJT83068.1 transcriptional regulator [Clostridioides difficile]VIB43762.1 conjugative transposon protein [Clostridioides difficile]
MRYTFKKPSYSLISSAMDGNEKVIDKLLAFYDPYISKCCLRPLYDEYDNVYIAVDMDLKGRIREALIKMILSFDIDYMDLEIKE